MKKFILFGLLFSIYLSLASTKAIAEEKGLGIYPPIVTIKAISPSKIEIPIRVKNMGNSTLEAQVSLRPFTLDQNGKVKLILHKDYTPENFSILSTSRLLQNDQIVSKLIFSPHQEQDLILEINIEPNQKSKDFYFSVLIESSGNETSQNSYSKQEIGAASNILLSIGDEPIVITSDFQSPLFTTSGGTKFEASLKNTSNHFSTVHPRIIIKNIFGNTIEIIDLKEQNILPNQVISFGPESNEVQANKKYLIGPYNAVLELNTTASTKGSQEISFIVVPVKQTIFTITLIFVIIFIILRVRTRLSGIKANNR